MASSSIVIKVRYGDTLRRLNAAVNDNKLALDMVTLKEKIRTLFNFGSVVEFTMTYVDEDGDEVTLADDGDLHDVMRQSLNPLRITVNLKSNNFNEPSGNMGPTSVRSPQNHQPFQTLNSGVSEILKVIPDPLFEALAKLPLELASKASSSSAPAVAELVEKMKDVYSSQILPSVTSLKVDPTTGGPPNVNSESVKNSKVQVNPEAGGSKSKKKAKEVQKVTEGVKFKDVQSPVSSTNGGEKKKKDSGFEKKDDISGGSLNKPLKHGPLLERLKKMSQIQASQRAQEMLNATNQSPFAGMHKKDDISGGSLNKPLKHDPLLENLKKLSQTQASQRAQGMSNANNQCPFSGISLTTDFDSQGHHCHANTGNAFHTGNVFHRGVICDGCGVHPITGPRFKSKVKKDYDLCSICFTEMGNDTDYIKMDHPTNSYSHQFSAFDGFFDSPLQIPLPGLKLTQSKLDSQFILDVNVLDGTLMAPFTAFTKTWRMKNNGSIAWPYGSQIRWIGGNRLCRSQSVDVKVPVGGLPVGKEVDISVDFTAPEHSGRYASHWQMVSPLGQEFGQRVWVVIQVDASMKNSGETSINLNLPPVTKDLEGVNQDHPVNNIFSGHNIISDPRNTSSVFNSTEVGTALGSLPVGPTVTSGLASEPISYPGVNFSVMPPVMSSGSASPPTVVVQPPSGSGSQVVTDDQEHARLKELEAMWFTNLDLNKEILRKNKYDLDKSVDDLCGVLEWDPMLDELHEMGFADDEVNRRLLKKNNGSIKGVVMDLINEEKA